MRVRSSATRVAENGIQRPGSLKKVRGIYINLHGIYTRLIEDFLGDATRNKQSFNE